MIKNPTYEESGNRGVQLEIGTTEHMRIEEELRTHTQSLDNMGEGVNIVSADSDIFVYTNPAYNKMFGYEQNELLGKHVSVINAPSDRSPEEIAAEIISVLNESGEWEGEVTNIKKDGTLFFTHSKVSTFEHSAYGILRIGIQNDITERVKAEKALRESEIKHKTLVYNIPGMVYRAYPDWSAEIITGSEEICGYTGQELNSKEEGWLTILHPDDMERVYGDGSELTKKQKNLVRTYRIITKDGHIRCL